MFSRNNKTYHAQHSTQALCAIVNEILTYESCKSLHSVCFLHFTPSVSSILELESYVIGSFEYQYVLHAL